MKTAFGGKADITRFKGLGEMQSVHLRETTMDPGKRTLLKVDVPTAVGVDNTPDGRREVMKTATLVENLMGRKPREALRVHPGKCQVRPGPGRLGC